MKPQKTILVSAIGLAIVLLGAASWGMRARSQAGQPGVDVMAESFSVAGGGPLTVTGVHPADILGQGGIPLIPCENLGLDCSDPLTGAQDDLNALSYGEDFTANNLPPLQLSVAPGAQGAAGSAVRLEASCTSPEAQADVFETALDGSNTQDLDGDGSACSSNSGYPLYLSEGRPSDNVDALDGDPCLSVDINCDGRPEAPIYFTLKPGSPSLLSLGANPADILVANLDVVPILWATAGDLGLTAGDEVDALCLLENGDETYGPGDRILFSLAAGSPSLATLGVSPADLLRPPPGRIGLRAAALGLLASDDLDAAYCNRAIDFSDLFLPVIQK